MGDCRATGACDDEADEGIRETGRVVIDRGESVNVRTACVENLRSSRPAKQFDSEVPTENHFQGYGKRQLWLKKWNEIETVPVPLGRRNEIDPGCQLLV